MDALGTILDNWQISINIWENNDFFAFIAFFIPGFITLKIYDFKVPNVRRDFSKAIFEVIAYSGMNFIVFYPLLSLISAPDFQQVHKYIFILSIYLIFLIMPIMWPDIYLKFLSLDFVSRQLPNPYENPWDFLFNRKKIDPKYVIVNFSDGKRVGGFFGPKSFASSSIAKEQLYLEEVWELDEYGFKKAIENSNGIMIFRDEMVSVEFYEPTYMD